MMRLDGFGRIDVHRPHEPAWQIRTDWQQRQADRLKAPADFREMIAPSGIAGEVNVARSRSDHESAPEIAIAIRQAARRKVLGRNCSDASFALPPVEFHRRDPMSLHQGGIAEGCEDLGAAESLQSIDVEMVIVIVAYENEIDRRKVLESNSRRPVAPRASEADRGDALGPDGIGEDVDSIELQQRRGVIDERDAQVAIVHSARRRRSTGRFDLRPRALLAMQHPLQKGGAFPLAYVVRIEEAFAVEVIRDGPAISRRGNEPALDRKSTR